MCLSPLVQIVGRKYPAGTTKAPTVCGNGAIKTLSQKIVHNFFGPFETSDQAPSRIGHQSPNIGATHTPTSLADQTGRFLAIHSQATKGKKCGKTGLQMISEVVYNQPIR
jgi:hypothetical protein